MKNFTVTVTDKYPRLKDWYQIGPAQRAELEAFVEDVLAGRAAGVTADGVLVEPGQEVWVFSSTGNIVPTSVRPVEALTNYYLFGQIPVRESFSTEQAAQLYRRYNK